jgi:hypothetical protein
MHLTLQTPLRRRALKCSVLCEALFCFCNSFVFDLNFNLIKMNSTYFHFPLCRFTFALCPHLYLYPGTPYLQLYLYLFAPVPVPRKGISYKRNTLQYCTVPYYLFSSFIRVYTAEAVRLVSTFNLRLDVLIGRSPAKKPPSLYLF